MATTPELPRATNFDLRADLIGFIDTLKFEPQAIVGRIAGLKKNIDSANNEKSNPHAFWKGRYWVGTDRHGSPALVSPEIGAVKIKNKLFQGSHAMLDSMKRAAALKLVDIQKGKKPAVSLQTDLDQIDQFEAFQEKTLGLSVGQSLLSFALCGANVSAGVALQKTIRMDDGTFTYQTRLVGGLTEDAAKELLQRFVSPEDNKMIFLAPDKQNNAAYLAVQGNIDIDLADEHFIEQTVVDVFQRRGEQQPSIRKIAPCQNCQVNSRPGLGEKPATTHIQAEKIKDQTAKIHSLYPPSHEPFLRPSVLMFRNNRTEKSLDRNSNDSGGPSGLGQLTPSFMPESSPRSAPVPAAPAVRTKSVQAVKEIPLHALAELPSMFRIIKEDSKTALHHPKPAGLHLHLPANSEVIHEIHETVFKRDYLESPVVNHSKFQSLCLKPTSTEEQAVRKKIVVFSEKPAPLQVESFRKAVLVEPLVRAKQEPIFLQKETYREVPEAIRETITLPLIEIPRVVPDNQTTIILEMEAELVNKDVKVKTPPEEMVLQFQHQGEKPREEIVGLEPRRKQQTVEVEETVIEQSMEESVKTFKIKRLFVIPPVKQSEIKSDRVSIKSEVKKLVWISQPAQVQSPEVWEYELPKDQNQKLYGLLHFLRKMVKEKVGEDFLWVKQTKVLRADEPEEDLTEFEESLEIAEEIEYYFALLKERTYAQVFAFAN